MISRVFRTIWSPWNFDRSVNAFTLRRRDSAKTHNHRLLSDGIEKRLLSQVGGRVDSVYGSYFIGFYYFTADSPVTENVSGFCNRRSIKVLSIPETTKTIE